ncbi:transketolase [Oceaniradius stylonematis]|jgi:transketolase|uniref:Transketolase n=1 Tax=Oceaniradius stylonematis TaxID=2184161 RepID=A0A3A8AIL7_9HYPH|nr:transketolase C-terminal domain-containing protein [Oceaniradius stylonematis]RKF06514.1 transketolase [Oceaniradius stylonematis]
MRDAFIAKLTDLARNDPRVVLITGDLGFGVLTKFAEDLPSQYVNAGVAEQNMTAIAAGMAMSGWKAYTYSIANFTTLRCLEQLRNDVCYHDAPVTVVSVGGGFSYGQLGMSHFATEDLAILRAIPNMRVVAPSETWETEDLTAELAAAPGPTYLRLDKGQGGVGRRDGEVARLGKARLVRDGSDVTLISIGAILKECIAAADELAQKGVQARVLSVSSLKPFDADAVLSAARDTGGIVTVEEHTVLGGLGGTVAETLLEGGVHPGFFRRIGLTDEYPTVVGDQAYLRTVYGMDAAAIAATVRSAL